NLQLYSAPRPPASPLTPTVRDWVAVGFRHMGLIVASFFTVMLGVVFVTWLMPPVYEAQVKIMVKRERLDQVLGGNQQTQLIDEDMTEQDVNSEVELIKSRDLLEKVVVASGLNKESKKSSLRSMFLKWSGQPEEPSDGHLQILRAARSLEKDLKVEPLKKTKLIRVTYASSDPEMSATVLHALVRYYLEKHLAVHRLRSEEHTSELQSR